MRKTSHEKKGTLLASGEMKKTVEPDSGCEYLKILQARGIKTMPYERKAKVRSLV